LSNIKIRKQAILEIFDKDIKRLIEKENNATAVEVRQGRDIHIKLFDGEINHYTECLKQLAEEEKKYA